MSAKPRTTPRDLVLPVPLARRPGAKARRLPPNVPVVRIPLENTVISKTTWRRGWDSNPRYAQAYNGFRDRPVRPLRHPSDSGPILGGRRETPAMESGAESSESHRLRQAGLVGPPGMRRDGVPTGSIGRPAGSTCGATGAVFDDG